MRSAPAALLVALLTASALLLAGCGSQQATGTAGSALPDITLRSFDGGKPLDLSAVQGPAVINVWASWCGPCRRELPKYQSFAQKYAGKVQVIGVDFQDTRADRARALIRQTGVRFPLYADPDGSIRARALPQVLLVDEQGRVALAKYVEIESVAQLESLVHRHLDVAP